MHSADRAFIAETTAKMLLEVKAVLFSEGKPFIFTSGWASPVYIDCRKLIFYPRIRTQLIEFAAATLARDAGFEQFDVVAGGETAGIPYAAWLADRLGLSDTGQLRPWLGNLAERGLVEQTGRTKGTRYFVPPELLRASGLDERTTLRRVRSSTGRLSMLRFSLSTRSWYHSR